MTKGKGQDDKEERQDNERGKRPLG